MAREIISYMYEIRFVLVRLYIFIVRFVIRHAIDLTVCRAERTRFVFDN